MQIAEIYITLKKTIADPQGLTIKHALDSLGYNSVDQVRIGKLIRIKFDSDDKKYVASCVDKMCHELLANPIIEDYSFKIKEE